MTENNEQTTTEELTAQNNEAGSPTHFQHFIDSANTDTHSEPDVSDCYVLGYN